MGKAHVHSTSSVTPAKERVAVRGDSAISIASFLCRKLGRALICLCTVLLRMRFCKWTEGPTQRDGSIAVSKKTKKQPRRRCVEWWGDVDRCVVPAATGRRAGELLSVSDQIVSHESCARRIRSKVLRECMRL
jgi:hypothetical protein